ncbi:hypothetical protein [Streptomyces mirabilis]
MTTAVLTADQVAERLGISRWKVHSPPSPTAAPSGERTPHPVTVSLPLVVGLTHVLAYWVFGGTGLSGPEAWLAASLEPAPGAEGEPTRG